MRRTNTFTVREMFVLLVRQCSEHDPIQEEGAKYVAVHNLALQMAAHPRFAAERFFWEEVASLALAASNGTPLAPSPYEEPQL